MRQNAGMPPDAIVLRFVDADSGKLMGEHPVPAGQIPESFEAQTTLDMGGNHFEVVSAEPMTRAEAATRGFMTIRLRRSKVQMVNPQELLCSLPSICNELPAILEGSSKAGKRVLTIHEDDWRQVELLSPAAAEAGAADLAAIADIRREQRVGSGFRKLHVRKGVAEPLLGMSLSLENLGREPGIAEADFDGLAFEGVEGIVEDGFAQQLPGGLIAYGRAEGGRVRELGLIRGAGAVRRDTKWVPLASWIAANHLLLVDWCRLRTAGQPPELRELLDGCWPIAGQSPGRIFLGLPKEARP
jgi:hypothetical protein